MKEFIYRLYLDFRRSLIYICVIAGAFVLLPLFSLLLDYELASYYGFLLFSVGFPAIIFITSVIFGVRQKFGYTFFLSVLIFFIPLSLLYFGEFSFLYLIVFLIFSFVGCAFGNLFRILKLK